MPSKGDDYETKKKYGKSFSAFENSVVALEPRVISEEITDEDISMSLNPKMIFVVPKN